jgi:hypothetical protein
MATRYTYTNTHTHTHTHTHTDVDVRNSDVRVQASIMLPRRLWPAGTYVAKVVYRTYEAGFGLSLVSRLQHVRIEPPAAPFFFQKGKTASDTSWCDVTVAGLHKSLSKRGEEEGRGGKERGGRGGLGRGGGRMEEEALEEEEEEGEEEEEEEEEGERGRMG